METRISEKPRGEGLQSYEWIQEQRVEKECKGDCWYERPADVCDIATYDKCGCQVACLRPPLWTNEKRGGGAQSIKGDMPDKAPPDKAAPDKSAPDKAAPDKAAPDKSAPDKAAPDKAAPDKSAPDKSKSYVDKKNGILDLRTDRQKRDFLNDVRKEAKEGKSPYNLPEPGGPY